MRFAGEGVPFVVPFALFALAAAWTGHQRWALGAVVVGVLVLLFFRDPTRKFEGPATTVVAPADGVVTRIDEVEAPEIGHGRFLHIVTFLSVFDVHVQRLPATGRVLRSALRRGKKVAAFRHDAGEVNEGHLSVIQRPNGDLVGIRQIAGLLARRVVCYLRPGDERQRGERMGLIKFGSRVDLFVPLGYRPLVAVGMRVRSGETPMAEPPAP